jgi:uncharacterized protein (TIGR02246 family)
MRRVTTFATIAALAILSVASASLALPPAADPNRARVEKLGKQFSEAFGKGDVAAVARMYAEDGMAFPPDAQIVKGRASIEAMWRGVKEIGVQSVEFEILDVQTSGVLLVETGIATLHVTGAGPAEARVKIKYVVVWKKQKDGSWKISHDIWNNLPAPPAAPTPAPAG